MRSTDHRAVPSSASPSCLTVASRIAPKSIEQLEGRIRKTAVSSKGRSIEETINRSQCTFVRGTDTSVLMRQSQRDERLDEWIRRRIRGVAWKQWKTPQRRYDMLRKLGCPNALAKTTTTWWSSLSAIGAMSNNPGMHIALSNEWFASRGLYTLTRRKKTA